MATFKLSLSWPHERSAINKSSFSISDNPLFSGDERDGQVFRVTHPSYKEPGEGDLQLVTTLYWGNNQLYVPQTIYCLGDTYLPLRSLN